MRNTLLEKLQRKEKPVGTFFFMGNAAVAECLALSGVDYIIVDMEHGPFGIESAADIMRGAELRGATVLARIPDGSRTSVLKALDIGAQGLVVPNIRSVQEVRNLVEYGKYFPQGLRGLAMSRAAGYGFADHAAGDIGEYMNACNRETLLLPQCETAECLEHIEEIAALDGIAGIFVGPFDLSIALGKPVQFGNPEFKAAIARVLAACAAAGKFCFIFGASVDAAKAAFEQGFDSVVLGTDSSFYVQAFQRIVGQVKGE
ncbi:host specificity protein [Desulfovibrio sp. OttesenSCG-928-I05]|nr:host specificity protein [Desulfovibrio sp. OttesenSCG-928-I05]